MHSRDGLWARAANLLVGGWLAVSAFSWEHAHAERVNAALVGYLCFVFAIFATQRTRARRLNTVLALWLFVSTLALPHVHPATEWNDLAAAVAMFLLSLVPDLDLAGAARHLSARAAHAVHARSTEGPA